MSHRLAKIPVNFIEAEIGAFPLASTEAFSLNVKSLSPQLKGTTEQLWRALENDFLTKIPDLSIDESISFTDKRWFFNSNESEVKLHEYLIALSEDYIHHNGVTAIPHLNSKQAIKVELPPDEARWAFRWLSFSLPQELLLAALGVDRVIPERVDQYSPKLYKELSDSGFAEPHLHINAGFDFSYSWTSLVYNIANPKAVKSRSFESPSAEFTEGKDFGRWLIRAAIMRYLLAAYLRNSNHTSFASFLRRNVTPAMIKIMGYTDFSEYFTTLLLELSGGRLLTNRKDFSYWQSVYSQLSKTYADKHKNITLDHFHEIDPIYSYFSCTSMNGKTPEMMFTSNALSYLRRRAQIGKDDEAFESFFWQVQRLKVLFFRHIVQRPMTPGLLWFVRFFSRNRPARPPRMSSRVQIAAYNDGAGEGLRSFEIRIAPGNTITEMADDVNSVIDGFNKLNDKMSNKSSTNNNSPTMNTVIDCGIIVHFPRDRGGKAADGLSNAFWKGTHMEPGRSGNFYRYGSYYRGQRNGAITLSRLILDNPHIIKVIRGIDICTDEIGVPLWPFIPIFRYIHDASKKATTAVTHQNSESLRLRNTIHAGEDFVHLATGLRHIDEIRRFLSFKEADRIGHGLALGVEPSEWSRRAGNMFLAKEDRLFDLIWEYLWYAKDGISTTVNRTVYLEHTLTVLAREIFHLPDRDDEIQPEDLLRFYEILHKEEFLRFCGFPDGPVPDLSNSKTNERKALSLLLAYLTDKQTFRQGRELIRIDPTKDVESLISLQRELKKALGRLSITVEVNPSSNLLIGHHADFRNHPLWRIMPVDDTLNEPPVAICVGADDPLTFNTDVRMEYQYLSDALTRAGFLDEQARIWLDKVRQNGLNSRFTISYERFMKAYESGQTYHNLSTPHPMP